MRFSDIYERNTRPDFYEGNDECNCGSFALGLTTWFVPYIDEADEDEFDERDAFSYTEIERTERLIEALEEGVAIDELLEATIDKDWDFILSACPWLKPIKYEDIEKTAPNEQIIAYRLYIDPEQECSTWMIVDDMDFHFRVRIDGEWYEKCGGGPVCRLGTDIDILEPWEGPGNIVYDGPIRFAKVVAV